jgi:excisionase family DNA binding protein
MEKLLTYQEAATALRVSAGTLRNWVAAQKIPFKKANGRVLFSEPELEIWLNNPEQFQTENKPTPEKPKIPDFQSTGSPEFDAPFYILKSTGLDLSRFIDQENKTIYFKKLLKQPISSEQRALFKIAANLSNFYTFKTDLCQNLEILPQEQRNIIFKALKIRFRS